MWYNKEEDGGRDYEEGGVLLDRIVFLFSSQVGWDEYQLPPLQALWRARHEFYHQKSTCYDWIRAFFNLLFVCTQYVGGVGEIHLQWRIFHSSIWPSGVRAAYKAAFELVRDQFSPKHWHHMLPQPSNWLVPPRRAEEGRNLEGT